MRDFAHDHTTETARTAPVPSPEAFVADLLLRGFRTRLIARLALATQVGLTIATGVALVAAVWALTTA